MLKHKTGILFVLCILIAVFGCAAAAAGDTQLAASGRCGNNATWTFDSQTGALTISGSGAIWDYNDDNPSPFWHNPSIRSVVIGDHIDTVGDRMFARSENLVSVILPAGLETIGYGAFCGTGLTEITIPAGVTVIGESAFYDCANLTRVTVMNPIVEIYEETFDHCASGLVISGWAGSLTEKYAEDNRIVFVPLTSGQCGDRATWTFDPQTGAMTISGSGAMWDYYDYNPSPFWHNPFIRSVVIDRRIDSVGDRMFTQSANLANVTLPAGLETIGYGTFCGTGLTEIFIPAGVTVIGESAFYGCGNLTRAVIMNSAVEIYVDTFGDCASGLVLYGWAGSPADEYACDNHIAFMALDAPDHQFVFPESLEEIGSQAFTDVSALSVVIPQTVTRISGNPFAGSSVLVVFGYSGTAAETFAGQYGYMFVSLNSTGIGR